MTVKSKSKAVKWATARSYADAYVIQKDWQATGEFDKVLVRRDRNWTINVTAYKVEAVEEVTEECQICGRHQCVDKQGALVNHGYQRPGWGFITGNCFGAKYLPYTKDDSALVAYVGLLKSKRKLAVKHLGDTAKAERFEFRREVKRHGEVVKVIEWVATLRNFLPPTFEERNAAGLYYTSFEQVREERVREAQRYLREVDEAVAHFEKRLAASPVRQ